MYTHLRPRFGAKEGYFKRWKTVGHIPREISRHVYYFIKTKGGFVNETMTSRKFHPSLISPGGLRNSTFAQIFVL